MRAQAKVRSLSKANVRVVRAHGLENLRVGKLALVPIGGDEVDDNLVAGPDGLSTKLDVLGRAAPHHHDGRDPSHHFFDSLRNRFWGRPKLRQIAWLKAELL